MNRPRAAKALDWVPTRGDRISFERPRRDSTVMDFERHSQSARGLAHSTSWRHIRKRQCRVHKPQMVHVAMGTKKGLATTAMAVGASFAASRPVPSIRMALPAFHKCHMGCSISGFRCFN